MKVLFSCLIKPNRIKLFHFLYKIAGKMFFFASVGPQNISCSFFYVILVYLT